VELTHRVPALRNDETVVSRTVARFVGALGPDRVVAMEPVTASDDFGRLGRTSGVPAFYWFFGGPAAAGGPAAGIAGPLAWCRTVADLAAWRALVRPTTRMFVVESPTNPIMQVADIRGLALLAAEAGALLAVDNTLCTPVYQTPIELGADLVLHSAAKYIDGQGRCGGGVVTGRADLIAEVRGVLRTMGPSLSPFNAWVFLKGLETLRVRMQERSRNAQIVAEWLIAHPDVERVFYTGLPTHPQAELVAKQQSGHGGLVSFTVRGGQERAWALIDRLELISNTTNIGDTKSMITHPATTTHGRLSCAQKAATGIVGNLLRVSVGLEDVHDVIADLDGALRRSADEAGR